MKKLKPLRKDVNYDLSDCSDEEMQLICDWLLNNDKDWSIYNTGALKHGRGTISYSKKAEAFGWWDNYEKTIVPEFTTKNKDLLSTTRSRNAYKQMYERLKKELQEKDYFIEEFRIEIKDLEKDISFYKASLESKDVQIKKMKKYIDELEIDKENSRVSSLEYIKCCKSKKELEEELQQANRYKTYFHTCLVVFGMALILIGILCVK